jgi:hypothetical protein
MRLGEVACFAMLAACGSGLDPGDPIDAAPQPDQLVEVRHEVVGFVFDMSGEELVGMDVCVRERPQILCGVSDANGRYEIFPPEADVSLAFTMAGHEQMLFPIGPAATGVDLLVHDSATLEPALAAVGFDFPAGPIVAVNVLAAPGETPDGATVSISVPAEGPIYAGGPLGLRDLDPMLTEVTGGFGLAAFGDMAEGDVEITVTHPTLSCSIPPIGGGWATAEPNRARVPAVNGFDTVVVFICE